MKFKKHTQKNRLRNYYFVLFFTLYSFASYCQTQITIVNKGVEITLNGGKIYNCGNLINKDTTIGGLFKEGKFFNDGEIHLKNDIYNQSISTLFYNPSVILNNGRVYFEGSGSQKIIGDSSIYFYKLFVAKAGLNDTLILQQNINVKDSLKMGSGNFFLNSKNIDLKTTGKIIDESNTSRIFGNNGLVLFRKATISSPNYNENYGGLGLMIKNPGISLGPTSFQRGHNPQTGCADGSVSRYFNLTPTNILGRATFRMSYFDPQELAGTTAGTHVIWTSTDNGTSWINRGRIDSAQYVVGDTIPIAIMRITAANSNCANPPLVDINPPSVNKCAGDSAILDAGVFPGSTYLWTYNNISIGNAQTITIRNSGKYVVTVKTINGCVGKDSIIANFNPSPTARFSFTSKCELDSTIFDASSSSGSNLKYTWDFGDGYVGNGVSIKHEYLSNGWKTVTLRALDSLGGCFDDTIRQVPVYALPISDFSFTSLNCKSKTTGFTNLSSVPPVNNLPSAITYNWNFGDGTASTAMTNPTHIYPVGPTDSTTYAVRLIATTSFGCRDTLIKNIFINPIPVPDFNLSASICFGNSIPIANNSTIVSGAISNYLWNFGDGTSYSGINPPSHNYNSTGNYTVTLITISDSTCTDSISKSINVNSKPTASFTAGNSCENAMVPFNNFSSIPSGNITGYQWDFGDGSPFQTTQTPVKSYNTSGTYTVTLIVFAGTGCADTSTQVVTIFPKPIASFLANDACLGASSSFVNTSTISDASSLNYSWNLGDGTTQTTANVSHLYPGVATYSVSLITTSINNCKDTFGLSIAINPLPVANFSISNNCEGSTSFFTNNSTGATNYIWDFGNGTNSTLTNPSLNYLGSGNFNVKLLASSGLGCNDSITKTITVFPKPVAAFSTSVNSVCLGTNLSLTNTSSIASGNIVTNAWDFGDGTSSFAINPSKLYQSAGNFNISLIVTSNKGCKDTSNYLMNVIVKPLANFSIIQNCGIDSISFVNTTNPISGLNYFWNFGDGSTSSSVDAVKTYTLAGNYNVKLVAVSSSGCSDSITKPVVYPITPISQFSFANACNGQSVSFTNTSTIGIGALNYNWSFGDGTANITTTNPSHTYNSPGNYQVQLISSSQSGCSDTLIQIISIGPKPISNFSAPISFCEESTISFTNSTQNSSTSTPYFWDFGDGTSSNLQHPLKQFSTPGTYTVVLISGSGAQCSDTIRKVISILEKPLANFTSDTVCFGNSTSFLNLSSTSSGTLSYQWDFGNFSYSSTTNANIQYSNSGIFIASLISSSTNGCTDTISKNVLVKSKPQLNLGGNISTCGSSYILDAQNVGSTYLWNNGTNSQTFVANSNGTYNVQVTSINGCTNTDTVLVTLNSQTKPQLGADTSICGNFILDAGYPNSLYLWNTGSTSNTITVSNSGTFIVSVTDQNNCTGSDTILISHNPAPLVNLGLDTAICQGENYVLNVPSNGLGYLWSDLSTGNSLTIVSGGIYWVEATDISSQCTTRDSILINIKTAPDKPFSNDTASCYGITLNANNPGCTYSWNTGSNAQIIQANSTGQYEVQISNSLGCSTRDTIIVSVNNVSVNLGSNQTGCVYSILPLDAGNAASYLWSTGETTQIIQPLNSGLYSVIVTDNIGCSGTGSVLITVNPSPLKPFGNDTLVCGSISLNALNNGSTYQWSGLSNATSQSINATSSGQYIVDITGTNSCVTKDTINVLINSVTPVNLGNDTLLCQNSNFSLNAGPGVSYTWSTGSNTQSIPVNLSALYWVSVTDAAGCVDRDSILVTFKPSPSVNLGPDTSACSFFVLNAQNTGLATLWNTGAITQTLSVNNSGFYFVDVTGLNGCTNRDSILLTINPLPIPNFNSNESGCIGDPLVLDAGNPGGTYTWNTGSTSQIVNVFNSGFYQVQITDANSCSSTNNVLVSFNNKPVANLGQDGAYCGSQTLNAGNLGSNYLWNNGSTNQTLQASSSGTYFVKVTNANNCFIIDSINLIINPLPSVNLGNDTSFCQGGNLTLNAGNSGSNFIWNNGQTTQTLSVTNSGNYFVQVTDPLNCISSDSITILVANRPVVNLGVDRTLCRGSSVSLNAGNAGSSFTWSSSNPGFTSNTQIITVVDTGKYWVNVSSAIGCNASDTIQIRLDDNYVVAHFLCASSSFVGDTLVFINLSYPNPQAYEWNFSDGIVTSETNPTHIFYTSNNFPVSLTATKLNCTDTLVKNINIQPRLSEQKDSVIQFMGIEITEAIVYPNPSSGIFNLKVDLNFNSDISLRIFDLQGKLLTYKSIRANTYLEEFNLNKLGAEDGIYLIDIIAGKARKTLRLIKTQ